METGDSSTHPRAILHTWGLRPKKKLGQNFLIDQGAAHRIARLALAGAAANARVVEIGAGTGALTLALLEAGGNVTAIEIDSELAHVLRERTDLAKASIVQSDALTFDYEAFARDGAWRIAGNLPYNIATPLIMRFCEMDDGPETATVMIQKDVADRLTARPGTPAYGSLSLAVQFAATVERAFTLGPGAFFPAPKVNSSVIRLIRRDEPPVRPRNLALYRTIVRAAFAYRRKTLANSLALATGAQRETVQSALARAGLDASVRGEQLSMTDFARLSDAMHV